MDTEILYRFFEGKASEKEQKDIKEWLESSPDNYTTLLKERKLFDAMILMNDHEIYNGRTEGSNKKVKYFFREFSKIAAIIIITLLGGWYYLSTTEKVESVQMQTITVPNGQRININLPDGSNIWLNSGTTIHYPISFNKKERKVILDGEGYFNISKSEIPFYVETYNGNVEVLGTQFNVSAYSDDKKNYEIALMEGKVKINHKNASRQMILTPNHKAILKDGDFSISVIEDYNPYRWKEGLICFKNESFENILLKVEKCYGITIVLQNDKVRNRFYTGKFRMSDGVEYALRVLQRDIMFKYERDDENNTIYIK